MFLMYSEHRQVAGLITSLLLSTKLNKVEGRAKLSPNKYDPNKKGICLNARCLNRAHSPEKAELGQIRLCIRKG